MYKEPDQQAEQKLPPTLSSLARNIHAAITTQNELQSKLENAVHRLGNPVRHNAQAPRPADSNVVAAKPSLDTELGMVLDRLNDLRLRFEDTLDSLGQLI